MKAKLKDGDIVSVNVLRVEKRGFFFPKSWSLVEYTTNVLDHHGDIKYSKVMAEWVLSEDVFND